MQIAAYFRQFLCLGANTLFAIFEQTLLIGIETFAGQQIFGRMVKAGTEVTAIKEAFCLGRSTMRIVLIVINYNFNKILEESYFLYSQSDGSFSEVLFY